MRFGFGFGKDRKRESDRLSQTGQEMKRGKKRLEEDGKIDKEEEKDVLCFASLLNRFEGKFFSFEESQRPKKVSSNFFRFCS